jgi:hypothetical protein
MKLLPAALLAAALLAPAAAHGEVVWLCKPGVTPNPCHESQATTVQAADGTEKVVTPKNPAKPPIDCFYVYPTVSGQQGVNADKSKDPEELAIARYQAARFSLKCRMFAPMYRQLTLSSIYTGSAEARAEGRKIAYHDVREAWLEYLHRYNHGRGFVLLGHSQGAGELRQLMRGEVDGKPAVRKRLISALLLGGNVLVKKGQKIGGDFQHVPACTSPVQLGCVIAWSTFDDPPPDNTRFGRSPATDITGANLPAGPDYEVLCTNPGSLGANQNVTFTSLLRSEEFPGAIGAGLIIMYGGPPPTADTPWLQPREHYRGRCETSNGANVLMVEPVGDARKLNASPTPDWGLHLADVNLPLQQLVNVVGSESRAWSAARRHARR